ncbi:MAG: hypothetical protein WAU86_02020 [Oricola sp.]
MPLVQRVITRRCSCRGALFPLPGWLWWGTHLIPMTYAVEPVRAVVFNRLQVVAATRAILDPGIMWGRWRVPIGARILSSRPARWRFWRSQSVS